MTQWNTLFTDTPFNPAAQEMIIKIFESDFHDVWCVAEQQLRRFFPELFVDKTNPTYDEAHEAYDDVCNEYQERLAKDYIGDIVFALENPISQNERTLQEVASQWSRSSAKREISRLSSVFDFTSLMQALIPDVAYEKLMFISRKLRDRAYAKRASELHAWALVDEQEYEAISKEVNDLCAETMEWNWPFVRAVVHEIDATLDYLADKSKVPGFDAQLMIADGQPPEGDGNDEKTDDE